MSYNTALFVVSVTRIFDFTVLEQFVFLARLLSSRVCNNAVSN